VVGCRRGLVFLPAANGRATNLCFRSRGCRRSPGLIWTAGCRRLSAASGIRATTRGLCSSSAGPGRKRGGRCRCGRLTWRSFDGATGRRGGRCDRRWNDGCDRRRPGSAAPWILFLARRLLLSISIGAVCACRPAQLQLNSSASRLVRAGDQRQWIEPVQRNGPSAREAGARIVNLGLIGR
jgi:hypothetical protein